MYKHEYETENCDLGNWGFGSGNIITALSSTNVHLKDGVTLDISRQSSAEQDIPKNLIFEKEV